MSAREVVRIVSPTAVSDGAGVRIKRLIGAAALDHADPFLLFDAFGSDRGADYIKGFPPHPHRGIETVTYMLSGRMRHADNHGHSGELGPGDVQWMTAGRGIVHSEMPLQEDGLMRGFQIWVNLPAARKMTAPRYQEIPAACIPVVETAEGVEAKVIAGYFSGVEGPVRDIAAQPLYLDVRLAAGAEARIPVEPGHTAILFAHQGILEVAGRRFATDHLALLGDGDHVAISTEAPAGVLLLAAKPWREPIVRHGPFVMNSRDEIVRTIEDYQAGRF